MIFFKYFLKRTLWTILWRLFGLFCKPAAYIGALNIADYLLKLYNHKIKLYHSYRHQLHVHFSITLLRLQLLVFYAQREFGLFLRTFSSQSLSEFEHLQLVFLLPKMEFILFFDVGFSGLIFSVFFNNLESCWWVKSRQI